MKTSFDNNILNSQPILIKFALNLFVRKCLSFQTFQTIQTHLLLDLRLPLTLPNNICYVKQDNIHSFSYY